MAFAISQNPKTAETPVVELPPMMTPEIPGVLPVEAQPVAAVEPQTAEERKVSDLQAAADLKATIVEKLAPMQSPEAKKQEFEKKIDKILEDGLKTPYSHLDQNQKDTFKAQGEKTTVAIKQLMESGKASGELITGMVRSWLKFIPANGSYFLEQEVKIKTDLLISLAKKIKSTL